MKPTGNSVKETMSQLGECHDLQLQTHPPQECEEDRPVPSVPSDSPATPAYELTSTTTSMESYQRQAERSDRARCEEIERRSTEEELSPPSSVDQDEESPRTAEPANPQSGTNYTSSVSEERWSHGAYSARGDARGDRHQMQLSPYQDASIAPTEFQSPPEAVYSQYDNPGLQRDRSSREGSYGDSRRNVYQRSGDSTHGSAYEHSLHQSPPQQPMFHDGRTRNTEYQGVPAPRAAAQRHSFPDGNQRYKDQYELSVDYNLVPTQRIPSDSHSQQPRQYKSHPTYHQPQLSQHQAQSLQHQPQPMQHQPKPLHHQPQLLQHQPQPMPHKPQPQRHQPQPKIHQPKPIHQQPVQPHQPQQPCYQPQEPYHQPLHRQPQQQGNPVDQMPTTRHSSLRESHSLTHREELPLVYGHSDAEGGHYYPDDLTESSQYHELPSPGGSLYVLPSPQTGQAHPDEVRLKRSQTFPRETTTPSHHKLYHSMQPQGSDYDPDSGIYSATMNPNLQLHESCNYPYPHSSPPSYAGSKRQPPERTRGGGRSLDALTEEHVTSSRMNPQFNPHPSDSSRRPPLITEIENESQVGMSQTYSSHSTGGEHMTTVNRIENLSISAPVPSMEPSPDRISSHSSALLKMNLSSMADYHNTASRGKATSHEMDSNPDSSSTDVPPSEPNLKEQVTKGLLACHYMLESIQRSVDDGTCDLESMLRWQQEFMSRLSGTAESGGKEISSKKGSPSVTLEVVRQGCDSSTAPEHEKSSTAEKPLSTPSAAVPPPPAAVAATAAAVPETASRQRRLCLVEDNTRVREFPLMFMEGVTMQLDTHSRAWRLIAEQQGLDSVTIDHNDFISQRGGKSPSRELFHHSEFDNYKLKDLKKGLEKIGMTSLLDYINLFINNQNNA